MYKDITMYQLADVARTANHTYEEYFEFEVDVDGMTFETGASYGQVGLAHEEGKNLLLLLDSNDVLFIDVCEVDELAERMFELEPDPEMDEDFELDEDNDTGLFELVEMGEEM